MIGGHLALRASLVSVIGRNRLPWPEAWFGGYARFQHGLRGSRVAIGAGHSLRLPFIGLEGGLVVARDEGEDFGVGGELTMVVTAGFIALYVRESLIDRDSNRWQTDVGLRLNFPFFLGSN